MLHCFSDDPRVFNSYCWADKEVVRPLVDRLRGTGLCTYLDSMELNQPLLAVLKYWRREAGNPETGGAGTYSWEHVRFALEDAIEESGIVTFWLSRHSVASAWVRHELEHARRNGTAVVTVCLDDTPVPTEFASHLVVDRQKVQETPHVILRDYERLWETLGSNAKERTTLALLDDNHKRILDEISSRAKAPVNGILVWKNGRINRLLAERFELCARFERDPTADRFPLDDNTLTAAHALIGNLIILREIAGKRAGAWPHRCGKCAGMENYEKVYPQLHEWIVTNRRWKAMDAAGCKCP